MRIWSFEPTKTSFSRLFCKGQITIVLFVHIPMQSVARVTTCTTVPPRWIIASPRASGLSSPHLTSPHLTQFASTFCRQPALSVATVDTAHQLPHPVLFLFFAVALLYSVLDLSRLWRPSGVVVITGLPLWLYPFFIMCPVNFHLLLRSSSLRFSVTSLLVILLCQRILIIRVRLLFLWTSIIFYSLLFIFHFSLPYIKTGLTKSYIAWFWYNTIIQNKFIV